MLIKYQILAVLVQWILSKNKFQQFATRPTFLLLIRQKYQKIHTYFIIPVLLQEVTGNMTG